MSDTPEPRRSKYGYGETIERLSATLRDAGNTIFATIDQAAAAKTVGLTLRPTTLNVFGNPKGGTPLMTAFPQVALELPLRLVVWEQDGAVQVAATQMSAIARRYGVTGLDAQIAAIDHAVATLLDTIAA
jgi:uncharacterized protein (DUF302 family)